MSSAAIGVIAYVVVFLICIALTVCATVAIRHSDDTVHDPRAITARYETHDWESYYDNDPDDTDLPGAG